MDGKTSKTSHGDGASAKPNKSAGDEFIVPSKKRKLDICHPEPPAKRCTVDYDQPAFLSGRVGAISASKKRGRDTDDDIDQPADVAPCKRHRCEDPEDIRQTETSNSAPSSQPDERSSTVNTPRAEFEAKYLELPMLGKGGFGSVYAGLRKTDQFPVAIKHIAKAAVKMEVGHGQTQGIPLEVLFMQMVAGGPESVGRSAPVSLLDWYDLGQEVLLVMERPVPCVDLRSYRNRSGPMTEDEAKNIMKQMVDASLNMHASGVFHRDIKLENILVETSSAVPRVRIIDFGCGCYVSERPYRRFAGTKRYAPPEFHRNGRYRAEPTTVWQLGALLYELLDGFQRFKTTDFMRNGLMVNSLMSRDCVDFLWACLEMNPVDRATLKEMQCHPWLS